MTDTNLPITRVALYTSGVGYFERGGVIDGDVTHTLLFPIDQVNDVLKSLVLLDTGGGTIQPVTYAARDPQEKQLQAFSIDLSDNPDQATLLKRLRGTTITVQTTASEVPTTLTGVIVGVEYHTVTLANENGTIQEAILTLLTDDGVYALPLAKISKVTILDTKINDELRQALQIISEGRDASKRPVTLAFSGEGSRHVLVGYLTETPLWQTTYRLVLGETPKLQGWALVQNTSQDDWTNVRLSLISGRPISFIQDLYQPLYVTRPTVEAQVESSPTPQAYGGALAAASPMSAGVATRGITGVANVRQRKMDAPSEERNRSQLSTGALMQSVATTGAKLGTSLFRYEIDVPVTVPRQQSAMIPFVAAEIEAEPIAIYNSRVQREHPLAGARVKNTTAMHLMGGPLTVFHGDNLGTSYVGDALIDHTEPDQTRLISYAIEQAIDADCQVYHREDQIQFVTISKGVVKVTQKVGRASTYRFKNNGSQSRLIVVEHPDYGRDWVLIEPKQATERTSQFYRFDITVDAGKSKEFVVRLEAPEIQDLALSNMDVDTLVSYIQNEQASPQVQEALQEVMKRRQTLSDLQQQIDEIDGQRSSIETGQRRIRENMSSLDHASSLYKRYVGELDTQETTIQTLATQREAVQNEIYRAQTELSDYVSALELGTAD